MNSEKSIELRDVTKYYSGETAIFENMTVSFPRNKIIGLVGENGSGKTTFIKMISGMTKHNKGEVIVLGKNIKDEQSMLSLRNHISILGDANRALYWNLTGMDNVEYFWTLKTGKDSTKIPDYIFGYIQHFNMESFIGNRVETYSKGMKQQLLLLIALLNDPQILFMDEPLNGLDYENAVILKQMISIYTQKIEGAVFITSHDQNFLNEVCDVQYEIDKKTIIERAAKDIVGKKIIFFIKARSKESHQFLNSRFHIESTTGSEKTIKMCVDVNNADFYREISRLLSNDEIIILEATGA